MLYDVDDGDREVYTSWWEVSGALERVEWHI